MGFFDKLWNGAVDTVTGPAEFVIDVVSAGRSAASGDFGGAAETVFNSVQEDLLGKTINGLFGPEGIGGTLIGELPEGIRDPARTVIDPVFGAWDWTIQEVVDRPLGTMFTLVNATHQNGAQSLFDIKTYAKAWNINDQRTFGQSLAANLYFIDPFDEDEYNSIKDDPIFNLISGTADFVQEFIDPVTIVGGTAIKAARGGAVLASSSRASRGGALLTQKLLEGGRVGRRGAIGAPREITRVYGGGTGIRPHDILGRREGIFKYLVKTEDQIDKRQSVIRNHTQQRAIAFVSSDSYLRIEDTMSKLDSAAERAEAFRQQVGPAGRKMSREAVELYANATTPLARARTMRALAGDFSVLEEVQSEARKLMDIMQSDNWENIKIALMDPKVREGITVERLAEQGDLAGSMFTGRMSRGEPLGDVDGALEFLKIAEETDWAVMSQFREALFESQQIRLRWHNGRYIGEPDSVIDNLGRLAVDDDGLVRAGLESILAVSDDMYPSKVSVAGLPSIKQLPWGSRLDGVLKRHRQVLEEAGPDRWVISEFYNPHTVGGRRGGLYGKAIRVITERTPQTHVFFDDPDAVTQFERVLAQASRLDIDGVKVLDATEASRLASSFARLKRAGRMDEVRKLYNDTVDNINQRLDNALADAEMGERLGKEAGQIDPQGRTLTARYRLDSQRWQREAEKAVGVTDDAGVVTTQRLLEDGTYAVIQHRMSKAQVKNSAVQPRYDVVQRKIELAQARKRSAVRQVPVRVGDVARGVIGGSRVLLDGPQQAWRSGMLLTPKWPMRVGLDEQLRGAAVLGGVTQLANLITSLPDLRRALALHKLDGFDEATDVDALTQILREQVGVRTVEDQLYEIATRLDEQLKEYGRVADMPDAVKAERKQLEQQRKVLSEQGDVAQREGNWTSSSTPPGKPVEFPKTTATIQSFEEAGGSWNFEDLSLEEQIKWHEAHGAGKNNPSRKYESADLEEIISGPPVSTSATAPVGNLTDKAEEAVQTVKQTLQKIEGEGRTGTPDYIKAQAELADAEAFRDYLVNTPIAQIEADVLRVFRNIINDPDTRIAVALKPGTVSKVKEDGVFKTTHDKGSELAASSFDVRRDYEAGIGIPANLAPELRASSGAVVPGAFVRQMRRRLLSVLRRDQNGMPTGFIKDGNNAKFVNRNELHDIYRETIEPVLRGEFGSRFEDLSDANKIAWGERVDELMEPHVSFDSLSDAGKQKYFKDEQEIVSYTGVNTYGEATLMLDPKVLERSKFTYGDSFNTQGNVASLTNASDEALLNMALGRAGSREVTTSPRQSINNILQAIALGNAETTLGLATFAGHQSKWGIKGAVKGSYLESMTFGRFTVDEIAAADFDSALKLGIEPRPMLAANTTPNLGTPLGTRNSSLTPFELFQLVGEDGLKKAVNQLRRQKVLRARDIKNRKSNIRRLGFNAALKGIGVGALMGNPLVGVGYGFVAAMSKRRRVNQALQRKAALNYAETLRFEGERMLREAVGREELAEARQMMDDATYIKKLIDDEDRVLGEAAYEAQNAFDAAEKLMSDAGVHGLNIGGMSFRNAFGDDTRYQEQIRAEVSSSRSQSALFSGAIRDSERQLRKFQDVDFQVFDALKFDADGNLINAVDIKREWANMMNRYTSGSEEFLAIVWSNDSLVDRATQLADLLTQDSKLLSELTSRRLDDFADDELMWTAENIVNEYDDVLPSNYFPELRDRAAMSQAPSWNQVTKKLMSDVTLGEGDLMTKIQKLREWNPGFGKAVAPEPVSHVAPSRKVLGEAAMGFAENLFKMFGTLPTDELARNPFFRTKYERELRRRVAVLQDPDGQVRLSQRNIDELERQARESALKEVREVMYDLAENTRLSEMVGNSMPFFNAWQEVIGRWAGFAVENPTFVANALRLYRKPWDAQALGISEVTIENDDGTEGATYLMFRPFGPAYDSDGNETTIFDAMSPTMRNLLIPEMLRDQDATIRLSKEGLNTIMQSPAPGFGPLITIPVREAILEKPGLEETFGFMFPFGHPEGGFFERAIKGNAPTWLKSGDDYFRDSQTTERLVQRFFQDIVTQRAESGDPLDWNDDFEINAAIELANERAKQFSMFRFAAGLFSPTSTTLLSPYEPLVQEARKLQREYGTLEGNAMFLDRYGEDFFALTARMTKLNDGVAASIESEELYMKHQDLVQAHPEIGAWVTASLGAADEQFVFSQAVYRRQMNMKLSPSSDQTRRERKTPLEAVADTQSELGWKAYTELQDYKRSKQEAAIAVGMSGSMNASYMRPLAAYMRQEIDALRLKYPAWAEQFDDYGRSTRRMSAVIDGFVAGLQDEQLLQRPSTQHVIDYFDLRMYVQTRLQERAAEGGSDNINANSNEDLLLYWEQSKEQMSLLPAFSAIYDRYFERDTLDRQTFVADDAFEGLL